jgi:hypothetical protein
MPAGLLAWIENADAAPLAYLQPSVAAFCGLPAVVLSPPFPAALQKISAAGAAAFILA